VKLEDLLRPADVACRDVELPQRTRAQVRDVAQSMADARQQNKPVIFFTGAHLIKNGLGPLLVDLVDRGMVTLVAGNGATAIHDFELALIGQTSEYVPQALEKGQFGMAYEFAYLNAAMTLGDQYELGLGESLGRMICDADFRAEVLARVGRDGAPTEFSHPEVSVLAACYRQNIPFTVHVGIGTDVLDQHPSFDGRAKGGCSGRDFLIYTNEVTKLTQGGVVLNVGSAVTGPEVLLKAVSLAGNVGQTPQALITADFDLRAHRPQSMTDESAPGYYFRDQKSVVTRVPDAFNGWGYYIRGDQKHTIVLLYKYLAALP